MIWKLFIGAIFVTLLSAIDVNLINNNKLPIAWREKSRKGTLFGFPSLSEVHDFMSSLMKYFPSAVHSNVVGKSIEDRDLIVYSIGFNCNSTSVTQVLLTALHHAREPLSVVVLMDLIGELFERYTAGDPQSSYILHNTEILVMPVINPDGYEAIRILKNRMIRKNRRPTCHRRITAAGVDLNRNYDSHWSSFIEGKLSNGCDEEEYPGSGPFSEPETRAVRDVVLSSANLVSAINYHAYGDFWTRPFNWQQSLRSLPNADHLAIYDELKEVVNIPQFGSAYEVLQYVTSGESDDWMYEAKGIISMSPEVGAEHAGFWPNSETDILEACSLNLHRSMTVLLKSGVELRSSRSGKADSTNGNLIHLWNSGLTDLQRGIICVESSSQKNNLPDVEGNVHVSPPPPLSQSEKDIDLYDLFFPRRKVGKPRWKPFDPPVRHGKLRMVSELDENTALFFGKKGLPKHEVKEGVFEIPFSSLLEPYLEKYNDLNKDIGQKFDASIFENKIRCREIANLSRRSEKSFSSLIPLSPNSSVSVCVVELNVSQFDHLRTKLSLLNGQSNREDKINFTNENDANEDSVNENNYSSFSWGNSWILDGLNQSSASESVQAEAENNLLSMFTCRCGGEESLHDNKLGQENNLMKEFYEGHEISRLKDRLGCIAAARLVMQHDAFKWKFPPQLNNDINEETTTTHKDKNAEELELEANSSKSPINTQPSSDKDPFIFPSYAISFNSLPIEEQWRQVFLFILFSVMFCIVIFFFVNACVEGIIYNRVSRPGPAVSYMEFVDLIGATDEEEARTRDAKSLILQAKKKKNWLVQKWDELMCCITAPLKTLCGRQKNKGNENEEDVSINETRPKNSKKKKKPKFMASNNSKVKFSSLNVGPEFSM